MKHLKFRHRSADWIQEELSPCPWESIIEGKPFRTEMRSNFFTEGFRVPVVKYNTYIDLIIHVTKIYHECEYCI